MVRNRVLSVLAIALIGALLFGTSITPASGQVTKQPPQPVTVTNTTTEPVPITGTLAGGKVPISGSVQVAGTKTEVIIDEAKDIDPGYSPYVYTFGRHDLSAYKQIRVMVVGDCVFEPPYNCADNPHDKVDLELRALMGHPDSAHTVHNWELWRAFHWMIDIDKGMLETDVINVPGGVVEFRVHYYSGPVHLRVLGVRY